METVPVGGATVPMPWSMESALASETFHASEVSAPYSGFASTAMNELMTGGNPTITVTGCCVNTNPPSPVLTIKRVSTNAVLTWASAPVATNTCGQTGVFTLQRALYLSNAPSSIVWSNITTVSPYTNAVPTNSVPAPFGSAYWRLRIN